MIKICLIIVLLLLTGFIFAEKAATLPDLINPNPIMWPIRVDDNNIYITDGTKILIYSAKDFKLKKVFGKAGEGPGEFIGYDKGTLLLTSITPTNIVVDSMKKLTYLTKEGNIVKEIKTMNGYLFSPFGDKFVGYFFAIDDKKNRVGTVNLYDPNMKKIKELRRFKEWIIQQKFNPYTFRKPRRIVYDNKLFINNFDDGTIYIYDQTGQELYSTRFNYKKVEVTAAHKKETIEIFRTDVRTKQIFDEIIHRMDFPQYFPVMKDFNITDGKIYVLTYHMEDNRSEFIVLDLKGKFITRIMFPLANSTYYEPYPFTIYKGKLYQLVDNQKIETWELYITDIK
ncbi:MAG: hypothetical protein PVH61_03685 [Candidatus Aminicenantes bacterium]|jgi:hypothetical protein